LLALAIEEEEAELDDDWFGQMDTQLRYYLHISGEELDRMSMSEWVRHWCHLKHIREEELDEKAALLGRPFLFSGGCTFVKLRCIGLQRRVTLFLIGI
jgi:hypothetical protein